ncbi:hypothetical protein HPB49_007468 [Dermacentor silvarum]|uniref:Uncharacterized protein n=1 Tax=Dermacentor silvarum TaxID=543639 RepID=A0ACB8DIH9_DERSI|nr:hypothetical protein HPB49_007468 [Dermacentor silvarum]
MTQESVKVVVRCRPMNTKEREQKCQLTCDVTQSVVRIDCVAGQCTLTNPADRSAPAKTFCFDGAYDHNSTTEQIYDDIVYPIVEASGPRVFCTMARLCIYNSVQSQTYARPTNACRETP